MKTLQIILFLFVVFLPVTGFTHEFAESEKFNFRKTRWGMSQEEVLKSESITVKESSETKLIFESALSKKNVLVEYFFTQGSLTRARYFINQGYYDPSKHYYDYVLIDKLLKRQYSEPKFSKKIWSANDMVKKQTEEAQAVYLGYLSLVSKWEIKGTSITHTLKKTGIAGGIGHSVNFEKKSS